MTWKSPPPTAAGQTFSSPVGTGIYIHIPFCGRKCPYCDFFSTTDFSQIRPFQQALTTEIRRRAEPGRQVDTVYFGGGTPSAVPAGLITAVLTDLRASFAVSADAEITVEVNPESVTPEKLAAYRQAGINRLSIGAQSFSDRSLALLQRPHSAADARQAYQSARTAGFENLSLDLIYGLPGQGRADWQRDLDAAVALAPEHLSCYTLTFEPRTVFHQRVKKGRLQPLEDGKVGELFLLTVDFLSARGYAQYEISNFARLSPRDGHLPVSRHNSGCWHFAPYLGFGPAAHSFAGNTRCWNVSSVRRYIEGMKTRGSAVAGSEELSAAQQMTEALYLGLRTTDGIDIAGFNRRFGVDFNAIFGESLDYFREKRLLDLQPGRCRLTRQGMLLLDAVVERLILNF